MAQKQPVEANYNRIRTNAQHRPHRPPVPPPQSQGMSTRRRVVLFRCLQWKRTWHKLAYWDKIQISRMVNKIPVEQPGILLQGSAPSFRCNLPYCYIYVTYSYLDKLYYIGYSNVHPRTLKQDLTAEEARCSEAFDTCHDNEREVDLAFWESDYVIQWEDNSLFNYRESIYPALFPTPMVTHHYAGKVGKLTYPHLAVADYFILHKEDERKYKVNFYADLSCKHLLNSIEFIGVEQFDEYIQKNQIQLNWI